MDALNLGPFPDVPGHAEAVALDQQDVLAEFADRFAPIEPGLIYLDGNSLGRLPTATPERIREAVEQEWGHRLIHSWRDSWWDKGVEIGALLAPLVGASRTEVIMADSTSVALFKLTLAAIRSQSDRHQIVTDDLNFPTDNYITAAAAELGSDIETVIVRSPDSIHGPTDRLIAALNEDTILLTLSHVGFKSGFMYDIERLTHAAHDVGALVLWDLSHSVGVVPIHLSAWEADLAVGCTYKYLNGGPGAPAFLYVNDAVRASVINPLQGWWGHANPFGFELSYTPADSIRSFQTGTMPILSLLAAEVGIAVSVEAGADRLRGKSTALTEFFITQAADRLAPLGFDLASPRAQERRGAHVSLRHPDGWRIAQALIVDGGVIPDFRAPDSIRFGLAPLYTSFIEVHTAVERLRRIVASGRHEAYSADHHTVT